METENANTPEDVVRALSYPLFSNKGWLKFFGIMNILYGVFAAITVVGIIIAWLPIWLGVLVNTAANKIEKAYVVGDYQALLETQQKLSTYFLINAILVLIGLVLLGVFVIVALTTGFYSHIWDMVRSQGIY
ncbi:MAG: hypothetical protein IEMM0006_1285 [bacterium]|nr:MAG: hypothetical protein IEMM0006_1285 [bacterium]